MKKEKILVCIKNGLEVAPAAMLVQVASRFESKIYMQSEDETIRVNAKSIMGMMGLGLDEGETIIVTAEGGDETEAIQEIQKFLSGK